jgi:hypothetical protein
MVAELEIVGGVGECECGGPLVNDGDTGISIGEGEGGSETVNQRIVVEMAMAILDECCHCLLNSDL